MRTNKNTPKIVLAITVAILATLISYSAFNNMHKQVVEQQKLIEFMQKNKPAEDELATYTYAVATKDLKAGEIVSDQDVDFKQFDIENKNAFDNRSDVINKVLLQDIVAGDTFTTAHIAKISNDNASLREGYRALTLPADNFQGKSEKITQGSCVDIYSTAVDNAWVLENVKILSFEGMKSDDSTQTQNVGIMDANSITFEVSAGDISEFISNVSKGRLMLVTRNPNDRKSIKKARRRSSSSESYSASALPKLPASVPITNLNEGSNMSGLPQPIQPAAPETSVEVIEANVKSKVTFD